MGAGLGCITRGPGGAQIGIEYWALPCETANCPGVRPSAANTSMLAADSANTIVAAIVIRIPMNVRIPVKLTGCFAGT